jgi:hypothetical protein
VGLAASARKKKVCPFDLRLGGDGRGEARLCPNGFSSDEIDTHLGAAGLEGHPDVSSNWFEVAALTRSDVELGTANGVMIRDPMK